MARHPFLSPEWIDAARHIRDDYADQLDGPPMSMRANVVVNDPPFADEAVHGHIDTSGGATIIEDGHLDDPELTIEVPYAVALAIFVERNPQAAMSAFLEGKIKVTGDVSKLLAIQPPPDQDSAVGVAREVARRLDEITEPPSD
ncbi:MAG: hypothetical protein ACR2QE_11385 [Acidimicrobiales bacterium]